MKLLLVSHALLTLILFSVLAIAFPWNTATSALFGSLTALINLALLVVVWPRLLAKKQVALSVATIVFKFALLGWILYLAVHSQGIQLGWFALGLGTVIPSVLVAGIWAPITAHEKVEV